MSKKNSNVQNLKGALNQNKKISEIYLNFRSKLIKTLNRKTFVVAVSGGPDSLALAALSQIYKHENNTKVFFVLIDHGIRNNSKTEANLVKKLLNKKGISLKIIRNNQKIKKNIQSQARTIRYKLLADFCRKRKAKFILTGHHSDDQIETFLIRLSRGSGIQGLSSMSRITKLKNNISLVRPLLEFKKSDLIYVAKKTFNKIFKDPSNKNRKYLRTRMRHLKKELEKSGIHHEQIIKSINNLASTKDTLNSYLKRVIKLCVIKKKKETLINLKELLFEPSEIKLKVLSHAIKVFSKSYYPPRSKKVLNLLKQINLTKSTKFTLGGCLLKRSGDYLYIKKETSL